MTQKKKTDEISRLEAEMDSLLSEISTFKDTAYDPTEDPLFASYKDSFTRQGQRAMQDTVGKVSALTGGYGNSYAALAGQSAYDSSLARLSDVLPTLLERADRKNEKSYNRLLDRYDALKDRRDSAVKESQWQQEFDQRNEEIKLPDTALENEDFASYTPKEMERYFLGVAYLEGKENAARLVEELAKLNIISKGNLSYYLEMVDSVY